jgi:hypothetical protein
MGYTSGDRQPPLPMFSIEQKRELSVHGRTPVDETNGVIYITYLSQQYG